jgi:hypothetical protein
MGTGKGSRKIDEFELYALVEKLTPEVFRQFKVKNQPKWYYQC